jgi:hypothetical protein
MFAGWLTAELAPQLLALTIADAGYTLLRGKASGRDKALALAASGLSAAAYLHVIRGSLRAGEDVYEALREVLGEDYTDLVTREARPDDPLQWRDIARFRMRHPDVKRVRKIAYAPGGRRFELDVFHNRELPSGRPVLLQVHGGGWVIGNKGSRANR